MDAVAQTRSLLLVLRLRGSAEASVIDGALDSLGLAIDNVPALLGRLERAGLVETGGSPAVRWRLTADGRQEGERLLGLEIDGAASRPEVTSLYLQFLGLNGPMLRVCTDWQLRDANPSSVLVNDHLDDDYDKAVLERLGAMHRAVLPICDSLTNRIARFESYRTRFTAAMRRIMEGDFAAVDHTTASYHGVWFELHEDLLATLGRDRSTEPLPDTSASPPT